jgi:phosphoribosylaminoimidazolecarboxamide formyltransferase / IMP cyclohydrolase
MKPAFSNELVQIKKALLSLSDKTELESLCAALVQHKCTIYATSSTADAVCALGFEAISVESTTGFPEILGGRVKTLHPKIFGGILAQTHLSQDLEDLKKHEIPVFDLVVCNLYPFAATLEKIKQDSAELTFDHCASLVEKIDIGGVSLLRAAAKNFARVCVLNSPDQYATFIQKLNTSGIDFAHRAKLAAEAFAHTAAYDAMIQNALQQIIEPAKQVVTLEFTKIQDLRYGENPHQKAFFAKLTGGTGADFIMKHDSSEKCDLTTLKALQGKELSYNNVLDVEHAVRLVNEFKMPAAVIVKHNVACGVACSPLGILNAYENAFACDRTSPFGGIVCVNGAVTLELAQALFETFLEVVVAPSFAVEAQELLSKKKNLRLVELNVSAPLINAWVGTFVQGGALFQESDSQLWEPSAFRWATDQKCEVSTEELMRFAFMSVKHLRSNAISLAVKSKSGGFQTVAVAGGFTNRVDAVSQALQKWQDWQNQNPTESKTCVLASDAFFPFPDSVELLKGKGVEAIVQPGGSVQDKAVIDAAQNLGIPMVLTGMRHFKH